MRNLHIGHTSSIAPCNMPRMHTLHRIRWHNSKTVICQANAPFIARTNRLRIAHFCEATANIDKNR